MKKKENQKKKNLQKKMRKKNKAAEENANTVEASSKVAEENGSNQQEELPQSNGVTNTNITTSQENGDASTKVYVGGIPFYSSEDDIRSYFEGCGTITEINCMTFPDTGKFRGIAIISYKTEAAAKRALALDGADMGGLFLKIQPYKATQATRFTPEMKEGYNRVYVGSLSWEITEEELKKFFSNCNIKSIRLGMDKETGEFRGYAHVDFSDSKSLKTALALDQSVLFGRPVRISCAVPLKKKSDAGEKPVAGSKPGVGEKSIAGSKPGAGEKSVAGYEPGSGEKSVASSKPVSGEKSVAGSKPGAGEKSAADEKPDAEERETVEKPPSSVVSGGKRKNRMCYGCRQKGHNLSECPNQQTVASTTI
jgi:nucleolin